MTWQRRLCKDAGGAAALASSRVPCSGLGDFLSTSSAAAVEVCGSLADCGSRREEIAVPTTPTTVPPWTQCCSSRSRLFLGSYHLRGRAAVPSRCVQYLHCQSSRCSLKSLRRSTSRQTLSCRRPLVLVRRQLCHLHCLTACPAAVRARLLSSSLDVWPHVERQRGWQRRFGELRAAMIELHCCCCCLFTGDRSQGPTR